jgi:hypothetical protein
MKTEQPSPGFFDNVSFYFDWATSATTRRSSYSSRAARSSSAWPSTKAPSTVSEVST